ncbi:hypothetical protein PHLCEN_2v13579 [Hermanssonia centrifuga]|uniref:Endonuclease/exonuclease/phosphatase domain-containing protein n=1 Tax=Hermanssonia centrifuga TaxID=98765 RepID=A0A2R6NDU2_9APHY|nr:hypothetical protein PHLCEN_2v13579 [Hermanssonia centrifuga]
MFAARHWAVWLGQWTAIVSSVTAVNITDIQGPAFQSPLTGQAAQNVAGIVTAKASTGFYIQGPSVSDVRASSGLYVYSTSSKVLNAVVVGDSVTLSGKVQEFRSSSDPTYLYGTELGSPTNITILSHNNTVKPLVLGVDRSPPTQQLSALDVGRDGFLSVPNNQSRIDVVNATMQPNKYGVDFWSSLEGQLVTVPKPVSIGFENSYGEFWVRGDWKATGVNTRGGLTLAFGPDGIPDANPETIIIGSPLDGTQNPKMCVGKTLTDITGVVQYQFGFYYILPLTAPTVLSTPDPTVSPTKLKSSSNTCVLTIGDYNVDNMGPESSHLPSVAAHIGDYLLTPDIMFLQEIQDNSGETDDGTVSADVTLSTLTAAIANISAVTYNYTEVISENDQDGGVPGGNIRPAYLYREEKVSLVKGSPVGGPLNATKPVFGHDGKLTLRHQISFNPGRIDPINVAWNVSRKPLVAAWETTDGHRFFTINVHDASKSDDSSSIQGDPRPPINSDVDQRTSQVEVIAVSDFPFRILQNNMSLGDAQTFVKSILKLDPLASIIIAGDFNEFIQTRSVFAAFNGLVFEADELAGIDPVERYTYVFDQSMEQLDHIFLSPVVSLRGVEVEHVHVNSWAPDYDSRTSDHDPSVARVRIC